MDIYESKKYGTKYIGVDVQESQGNVVPESTFVKIENGDVIAGATHWFKYIGSIENGKFTSIEEVRKILAD